MNQPHALANIVRPVTVFKSERLSDLSGQQVILAVETLQHTGSFKFRAAYNVASKVPQTHLIAASSGNFGQALAYACRLLGKRCTIVMPVTSSKTKIAAVQGYGGETDLVDVTKETRASRVRKLAAEYPDAYLSSAYDDDLVIEGNSTLGLELLCCGISFDCIVAPVGGGGLASGLVRAFHESGSKVDVFGAEPALGNDAVRSLRTGKLVSNDEEPPTLADGARTLSLGFRNWAILEHGLAGIFEVSEIHIRQAVKSLFLYANLKIEPTGGLSYGALLANPPELRDRVICFVISGGNVDPELYATLIQ
jgi:threonine dehydratase